VQAARLLGARRVVAVGRDRDRLEATLDFGADARVALDDPRGLGPALADACPDGATLIFDPLWGEPLVAVLGVASRSARVLQLGQSAAPEATIPSGLIRGKDIDMFGYTNLTVPFDVLRAAYLELVRHIAAGRIRLRAEVSPLVDAEAAWRRLEKGAGCKVIVRPDGAA
jgi:NADPH2:quinone reductase